MTAVYVAWGLIFASIFHAVFNLLVYQYNTLLIYPTVFLAAIGFVILYDFEKLRKIEEADEKLISKP